MLDKSTDVSQLVCILDSFMKLIFQPTCSRRDLIELMEMFSPENQSDPEITEVISE